MQSAEAKQFDIDIKNMDKFVAFESKTNKLHEELLQQKQQQSKQQEPQILVTYDEQSQGRG